MYKHFLQKYIQEFNSPLTSFYGKHAENSTSVPKNVGNVGIAWLVYHS